MPPRKSDTFFEHILASHCSHSDTHSGWRDGEYDNDDDDDQLGGDGNYVSVSRAGERRQSMRESALNAAPSEAGAVGDGSQATAGGGGDDRGSGDTDREARRGGS